MRKFMVVDPNAFRVISGFFVFAFGAFVALPTSNLLFRLSPDRGGAKTLITWSLSGPIRDSYAISIGSWGGIGNYFDGAFNSSYFTSSTAETFAVAGAGSFNNLTTTSSAQLSQILMGTDGSSRFLALSWEENGLGGACLPIPEIKSATLLAQTLMSSTFRSRRLIRELTPPQISALRVA